MTAFPAQLTSAIVSTSVALMPPLLYNSRGVTMLQEFAVRHRVASRRRPVHEVVAFDQLIEARPLRDDFDIDAKLAVVDLDFRRLVYGFANAVEVGGTFGRHDALVLGGGSTVCANAGDAIDTRTATAAPAVATMWRTARTLTVHSDAAKAASASAQVSPSRVARVRT